MKDVPDMEDTLAEVMVRKALDISLYVSMTRSHADLELLVSRLSMETHIFTYWEEFTPTLEDVLVMFYLPIFGDEGATGLILFEEEERKAQLLTTAFTVTNKSTSTSWISYFWEGERWRKGVTLEAFLSYWLSRLILSNRPEDDINAYVFPLAIYLAKGKNFHSNRYNLVHYMLGWMSALRTSCVWWGATTS